MDFIGTGNRILTENFTIGYLYTITFRAGYYINSACIGKGADNVMFQRTEPELLFNLNMDTAPDVYSIELYSGGGGTDDYETLSNKPQINSHTLTGNMSGSDLDLQSTISDLDTIRTGAAAGATAVQPAALSDYQPVISDLDTIRAGAAAGATAVQPADMTTALATKQDALNAAQLNAVNSGITSTDVAQITTNENNILSLYNQNGKTFNLFDINRPIDIAYHATAVVADNAITIGSVSGSWAYVGIKALNLPAGSYRVSGKISNLVTGAAGTTRITVSQYSSASQGSLTYINITQNGDFSGYFTWTGGDIYLLFYVNNSSSSSVDYTYTASELQIISTSAYNAGFTDYQPYAMSNAELTAAIQALQAQLNQ